MTAGYVIERIILWTGYCFGPALCIKIGRKYYLEVENGLMQPKEAVKVYGAASLVAPIASICWVLGLGLLGQCLGMDLSHGESTGWAFLMLPFFVFAVALLSIGVFARAVHDINEKK